MESDSVSSQINEMRHSYIESNNRMVGRMEMEIREFVTGRRGSAEISVSVGRYLCGRVGYIRSLVVDQIGAGLRRMSVGRSARTRRFPRTITEVLEESFEVDQYPSECEKKRLACSCGLSPKQINNWFTNKRNRSKNGECREY